MSDSWKNLAAYPDKVLVLRLLVCHLLGQLTFQMKLYSFPQHLVSRLIGLSYSEQSEFGLGNKYITFVYSLTFEWTLRLI